MAKLPYRRVTVVVLRGEALGPELVEERHLLGGVGVAVVEERVAPADVNRGYHWITSTNQHPIETAKPKARPTSTKHACIQSTKHAAYRVSSTSVWGGIILSNAHGMVKIKPKPRIQRDAEVLKVGAVELGPLEFAHGRAAERRLGAGAETKG